MSIPNNASQTALKVLTRLIQIHGTKGEDIRIDMPPIERYKNVMARIEDYISCLGFDMETAGKAMIICPQKWEDAWVLLDLADEVYKSKADQLWDRETFLKFTEDYLVPYFCMMVDIVNEVKGIKV